MSTLNLEDIKKHFGPHLSDHEICRLLRVSQKTLNNKVCRGDDLPEFIKPPGCRHRLWPASDVIDWLSSKGGH